DGETRGQRVVHRRVDEHSMEEHDRWRVGVAPLAVMEVEPVQLDERRTPIDHRPSRPARHYVAGKDDARGARQAATGGHGRRRARNTRRHALTTSITGSVPAGTDDKPTFGNVQSSVPTRSEEPLMSLSSAQNAGFTPFEQHVAGAMAKPSLFVFGMFAG